jgi:hypothetical protein
VEDEASWRNEKVGAHGNTTPAFLRYTEWKEGPSLVGVVNVKFELNSALFMKHKCTHIRAGSRIMNINRAHLARKVVDVDNRERFWSWGVYGALFWQGRGAGKSGNFVRWWGKDGYYGPSRWK